MEVEHLADDLPLAVELDQIEEVGEPVAGPVVDVDAHAGAGTDHVNVGEAGLNVLGRAVLVVPVVQALDRTAEQVLAHVAVDRRGVMEGRLHGRALAAARALEVVSDKLRDGIDFIDVGGVRHVNSLTVKVVLTLSTAASNRAEDSGVDLPMQLRSHAAFPIEPVNSTLLVPVALKPLRSAILLPPACRRRERASR